MRHDRNGSLRYAPLQGDTAFKNLPERFRLNVSTAIYQRSDDELYERSGAVLRALIDSGSRLGLLAKIALWIPRSLRDALYDFIANNRHRLFAEYRCDLPDPEQRAKILP